MQLRTPAATAAATAAALMITTGLAAQEPSFVAEQVEPGVERIVSDGADFDMATLDDGVLYAFDDIATGPDGEVWVVAHRYHTATGRTEGPLVWELGTPGDYGPDAGFPAEHTKLIVDVDGTPIVAAPGGIKAFDGSAWVDSTGSRIIETGGGAVILIEPADLAAAAGSLPSGASAGVLAVGSDLVGYTLDEELGRRFMREWPSWWESCSDTGVEYRNGTGCIDRSAEDERGVGVGHDDEGRALFLADETTGRIARSPEGAIWVLAGPTLDDLWSRRSTESGAIYRIDPQAPGHRCEGC